MRLRGIQAGVVALAMAGCGSTDSGGPPAGAGGAAGSGGSGAGSCGAEPTTMTTGPYNANSVTVGDQDVFWSVLPMSSGTGQLYRVSKAGGAHELVGNAGGLFALGSDLYWSDGKDIVRTTFPAKDTQLIVSGHAARRVAADGARVVWAERPSSASSLLMVANVSGQNVKTLHTATDFIWHLTLGGPTAYFDIAKTILSVPVAGGAVSTLVPERDSVMGIGLTEQNLYFAQSAHVGKGGTFFVPRSGGTVTQLSSRGAQSIAVDDKAAYIIGGDSTIVRIPLDGSADRVIAKVEGNPTAITVDATCVYWVHQQDGRVMKASKL